MTKLFPRCRPAHRALSQLLFCAALIIPLAGCGGNRDLPSSVAAPSSNDDVLLLNASVGTSLIPSWYRLVGLQANGNVSYADGSSAGVISGFVSGLPAQPPSSTTDAIVTKMLVTAYGSSQVSASDVTFYSAMLAGSSMNFVASQISKSSAFLMIHPFTQSDTDYIQSLALNTYGRMITDFYVSHWLEVLNRGQTRGDLLIAFPEYFDQNPTPITTIAEGTLVGTNTGTETGSVSPAPSAKDVDYVLNIFLMTAFGRQEVSAAEREVWFSILMSTRDLKKLATRVVVDPRFMAQHPVSESATDYIQSLAINTYGRPVRDEFVTYWIRELDNGLSRTDMLAFFAHYKPQADAMCPPNCFPYPSG